MNYNTKNYQFYYFFVAVIKGIAKEITPSDSNNRQLLQTVEEEPHRCIWYVVFIEIFYCE